MPHEMLPTRVAVVLTSSQSFSPPGVIRCGLDLSLDKGLSFGCLQEA